MGGSSSKQEREQAEEQAKRQAFEAAQQQRFEQLLQQTYQQGYDDCSKACEDKYTSLRMYDAVTVTGICLVCSFALYYLQQQGVTEAVAAAQRSSDTSKQLVTAKEDELSVERSKAAELFAIVESQKNIVSWQHGMMKTLSKQRNRAASKVHVLRANNQRLLKAQRPVKKELAQLFLKNQHMVQQVRMLTGALVCSGGFVAGMYLARQSSAPASSASPVHNEGGEEGSPSSAAVGHGHHFPISLHWPKFLSHGHGSSGAPASPADEKAIEEAPLSSSSSFPPEIQLTSPIIEKNQSVSLVETKNVHATAVSLKKAADSKPEFPMASSTDDAVTSTMKQDSNIKPVPVPVVQAQKPPEASPAPALTATASSSTQPLSATPTTAVAVKSTPVRTPVAAPTITEPQPASTANLPMRPPPPAGVSQQQEKAAPKAD